MTKNTEKLPAWYNNEMGYTHTLVQHVILTGMAMNDPAAFAKHCEEKYGKDYENRHNKADKLIKGIE
jgi:gamma-glutamyl-gamma-aminobutyrate hydrolase PuuD